MKKLKEVEADDELISPKNERFIDMIVHAKPTPESIACADKVGKLNSALSYFVLFVNYGNIMNARYEDIRKAKKAFKRLRTAKRAIKALQAESMRNALRRARSGINIDNIYKKIISFDGVIDKKYWNIDALTEIEFILREGWKQTIDEAVAAYEEFFPKH